MPRRSIRRSSRPSSARSLGELGAALNAALVIDRRQARPVPGDGGRRPDDRRRSSPQRTGTPSATCASGSTPRPPAATSTYDAADGTLHAARRARVRRSPTRRAPSPWPGSSSCDRRARRRDEPRSPSAFRTGDGRRLARARRRPLRRHASASSGRATPHAPRRRVDPGARRRRREARARRDGRRRRLRPRRLDDPHGPGVPELDVRRLRLPRRLDRDGRERAPRTAGVADRVTFEVASAQGLPRRAATTSSRSSTASTTWAIRSGAAAARPRSARPGRHVACSSSRSPSDRLEDNLNPVGRIYYAASTLICTPASLSQEVGLALGAQAGEDGLREVSSRAASRGSAAPPRRRST